MTRLTGVIRGYVRVSSQDQNLEAQLFAIKTFEPPPPIYIDRLSGTIPAEQRAGFKLLLQEAQPGDTVAVYRLDRLTRGLSDLLRVLALFRERQLELFSATETIDTRTPSGRFMLQVFGSIAELERETTRERAAAGVQAARARGVRFGRPAALSPDQVAIIRSLWPAENVSRLASAFNVSRRTIDMVIQNRPPYATKENARRVSE